MFNKCICFVLLAEQQYLIGRYNVKHHFCPLGQQGFRGKKGAARNKEKEKKGRAKTGESKEHLCSLSGYTLRQDVLQ